MGLARKLRRLRRKTEEVAIRKRRKALLEPLEPRMLLSADLKFTMTGDANDLTLRLRDVSGTDTLELVNNDDLSVLQSQALAETSAVIIEGADQDDKLTIDFRNPFSLPVTFADASKNDSDILDVVGGDHTWNITGPNSGNVGNVSFNGAENLVGGADNEDTFIFEAGGSIGGVVDGGPGGFDTIVLSGGTYDTVAFTATGADSGSIERDGDIITYAGLEPLVASSITAANVSLTFNDTPQTISIQDSGTADDGQITVVSSEGEDPIFSVPTNSLTINAGSGSDIIIVKSLDNAFGTNNTDLIINAGGGDDVIEIGPLAGNGPFQIDGGDDTDTITAARNTDFALTDTSLTMGTESITLSGAAGSPTIERAILTGRTLNADSFSGQVIFQTGVPDWTEQGPAAFRAGLGLAPSVWDLAAGAIEAIAVHPDYPNTKVIYLGTVNGGVWKIDTQTVLFANDERTFPAGPDSRKTMLDDFAKFLKLHTDLTAEVAGHADSTAGVDYNQELSEDRANTIRDYLISKGIDSSRLILGGLDTSGDGVPDGGFGESEPIGDNSTAEGRALNRRVEMTYKQPLTDAYPSLSISSLAISPTDSDKIYAGVGRCSAYDRVGGPECGLLYSTNGGESWRLLGEETFQGLRITDVLPTPISAAGEQVLYVSTLNPNDQGGMFRGVVAADGTATFVKISGDGSSGLPSGDYTGLAMDPGDAGRPLRLYAANPGQGVFRWEQGGDGRWHPINTGLQFGADSDHSGQDDLLQKSTRIKLAIHEDSGTLYAGVIGPVNDHGLFDLTGAAGENGLIGLFKSSNFGNSWARIPVPTSTDGGEVYGLHPQGQGNYQFSITVDPTNPNMIYVGGDTQGSLVSRGGNAVGLNQWAGRIFRYSGTNWEQIVGNTVNNTAPHADSRGMVFAGDYVLLEIDDGGINRLQNPRGEGGTEADNQGARQWSSVNNDLRITEITHIAYDPLNNSIIVGTQDNGSIQQIGDNWEAVHRGDGNSQAAISTTLGANNVALRYSLANAFGTMLPDGTPVSTLYLVGFDNSGTQIDLNGDGVVDGDDRIQIGLRSGSAGKVLSGLSGQDRNAGYTDIPFVVNTIENTRMLIGSYNLYESINTNLLAAPPNRVFPLENIRQIDPVAGAGIPDRDRISALVYGGRSGGVDNAELVIAARSNSLLIWTTPRPAAGQMPPALVRTDPNMAKILDIAVDPDNWRNVYVIDARNNVYRIADIMDPNQNWVRITGNLEDLGQKIPRQLSLKSIEYVNNGVNDILLVGGAAGVARLTNPGLANVSATWSLFGNGLPTALVADIEFLDLDNSGTVNDGDLLLAGTLGRGVWSIGGDAILRIAQPSVLQIYGNNGASPNDSFQISINESNPLLFNVLDLNKSATAPIFSSRFASFESVEFFGRMGDDGLTVDHTQRAISIPYGIHYDGGIGNNTLILSGGQVSDWYNDTTYYFSTLVDQTGHTEVVHYSNVNTFDASALPSPVANTFVSISGSFEKVAGLLTFDQEPGDDLTTNIPVLGASMARALNAAWPGTFEPISSPGASPSGMGETGDTTEFLRRFFETGTGAFNIGDIASFTTPQQLVNAFLGLDESGSGSVSYTGNGTTGYEFTASGVKKMLGGQADLGLNLLDGAVDIDGTVDIRADVTLNIVFGVDVAHGFYIKSNATPELAVDNIRVTTSDAVSAVGHFGFLDVALTEAQLVMDPQVKFEMNVGETSGDGFIQLRELVNNLSSLVSVRLLGDPGDSQDDVKLTGTFEVSTLLPGTAPPFSLVDARVDITWPNINELTNVTVTATPGFPAGDALMSFLKISPQDVLDQVNQLGDQLNRLGVSSAFGIDLPLAQKKLNDLLHILETFNNKISQPLQTSPGSNIPNFRSAQSMAAELARTIGIDPSGLGLSYDSATHELTYPIKVTDEFAPVADTINFDFNAAEGLADVRSSSAIGLAANVTFDFILGVDLSFNPEQDSLLDNFFIRDANISSTVDLGVEDFDATARFGFVGIDIDSGRGSATTTFSLDLIDPKTNSADGRIDLQELIDTLTNGNPLTLVKPTITGTALFSLPVSVPFLGLEDHTTITAEILDIKDPNSLQVDFGGLNELLDFKSISPETVLAGLRALPGILRQLADSGALGTNLPFIGSNLKEAIAVADKLDGFLDTLEAFTTVEGLQTALENAFGTPVVVQMTDEDVQFAIDFSDAFSKDLGFRIEETVGDVGFKLSGDLRASGSADVGIRFGLSFDGSLPETERFYLLSGPDSLVELNFKMITELPITATASLGFIRVGVKDGSATVAGRTGSGIDPEMNAKASLAFVDPGSGAAADGKITLTEILNNPLSVLGMPAFDGAVQVVLPITPPIDLPDVEDVTVQFDWSDLGDPNSLSITYDEAALNSYLIDPATLLDPEVLSAVAKAGLRQLGEWLGNLAGDMLDTEPFTTKLPLIEKSIADLVNLGQILPLAADAILAFIDDPGATTQNFVNQISASLLTLESSITGMDVTINPERIFAGLLRAGDNAAAGWLGYSPDSDQLLFNVGFRADRTLANQVLRLAGNTNTLGASFEAPFSADATLDFDLTFGYDLADGLLPGDAIFVRLNDFRVGVDVNVDASANFDLGMGFLSASVENGTLNLSVDLGVELANLSGDPADRLTLNDVLGSSPAGLINTKVLNSSLEANLPLRADFGDLAGANATLIISGDPLSGELPDIRVEGANLDDFTNFSQISPSTILSALEQIGAWLGQLSGANILDIKIPLVDVTVGEALDLGQAFSEQVTELLYVGEGVPAFNNTEEFLAKLAGLAGIDPALLESNYDAATDLLTYRLKLTHTFLDIPPADFVFDMKLGAFGGVESSSQFSVNASGELDLTIGFDLSASNVVLTANRALPSSGDWPGGLDEDWRLPTGQNANFDLVIDGEAFIPVAVSGLVTRNNTSAADLINDMNAALQSALRAAGLEPNSLVAGIEYNAQGAFLTLTTNESFEVGSLLLQARPDNPAVTVFGFAESDQSRIIVLRTSGLPLPEDGRLSADAHFKVSINGNDAVSVTVAASSTVGTDGTQPNRSRQDLIADINGALADAGLTQMSAGLTSGGRLKFTATGAIASLQITASANDPAVTELGLAESQIEGPYYTTQIATANLMDQLVIDDLSFRGQLGVTGAFDAAASFGMVDIVISGASGVLTGAVDFDLINPAEPIRVTELFDNLSHFGSYLAGAGLSLTGTATLDIPVSVEGALADLFNLSVDAGLTVSAGNIFQPSTWSADLEGLDGLADFGGFDFDTILAAVEGIVQYLRTISGEGLLGTELPLINVSVGDALDFAEKLAEVVQNLRNNPAGTLQVLDQKLEAALASVLGQAPGNLVNLVIPAGGKDFQIELGFSPNIPSHTVPLNFDLESLGLTNQIPGVNNLLEVSADGSIHVDATAELNIDLGLDLTDPTNPKPYLRDSTGLLLGAKFYASNLDFDLAVGPLGVHIRDGFVTLGVGDTPAALDFATFAVDMKPVAGGKYYLLESFPGINDITIAVTGEVHAELPVYYPTESTPLDPAKPNIEMDIASLSAFFENPGAATQFTTPGFSGLFDFADLFSNIDGIIEAIDFILGTLQDALDSEVFSRDLPLIGNNLKDAANFISDLRDSVRAAQDAIKLATDPASLKLELFNLFNNQLHLLKDGDDEGNEVTLDDIGIYQVNQDPDPLPDEVEFRMKLGGGYTFGTSIGFDFGLPGLGFDVSDASSVEIGLDWEFNLGFGVSRTDGFYLTTYEDGSDDHTLDVRLDITVPGLQALGRIGFLAVLIEDDQTDHSHLSGDIKIDILDPVWDPNNRLTFNDLASEPNFANMVDISLGLDALVNLDLTLGFAFNGFEADTRYPTLTSDFIVNWDWNLGLGRGFDDLSAPSVSFDNIRLQIGTFLSGFVGDILGPIQQILEPIQPLIDLLTYPLPVISDLRGSDTTILDLGRLFGYEEAADFIEGVIGIINLVNSLDVGENIYLDLGSLSFGEGFDLSEGGQNIAGLNADELTEEGPVSLGAPAENVHDQLAQKAGGFVQAEADIGSGFSIPILENPSKAIGLLFGQNVDLFEYIMPTLGVEFTYRQWFGPFWGVVYVGIGGRLGAEADFTFGYDTAGLKAFIDNPGNPSLLADGFYVSDRTDSEGTDPPEVTLFAELFASAKVDILIAALGADGGIRGKIDLNVRDRDDYGPPDGKIRLSEIAENFSEGGLL